MKTINPHITGHRPGDSLGLRLRAAREHAGLKIVDAANSIGITPNHLGRIERGGRRHG